MNIWHDINSDRIKPEKFVACIEISAGSKTKYELDKESGMLMLDRILYTSTHYPANYGFIPKTYADDGDPLDVLILSNEKIRPFTLVNCYPIGVVKMTDNDAGDEKIIAILDKDPNMNSYKDILDLPKHRFEEIAHFFGVYKDLENISTSVNEVQGHAEAIKIIESCIQNYKRKFPQYSK